jgi:WD40 repeat protein
MASVVRWAVRGVALVVFCHLVTLSPCHLVSAEEPAPVEKLIKQLGDDEFAQREAASKRLKGIGEPALAALRKAAVEDADAEVRLRAQNVANAIASGLFGEPRVLQGHQGQVNVLAVSADGSRVLSGSLDGTLRLWDVAKQTELKSFADQPGAVWGADLSPDGKKALFGCGMIQKDGEWVKGTDFAVRLWDLEAGKELKKLEGHDGELRTVAFSPDGKRALSAGWDKVPRLWDLESGKELVKFEGHTGSVRSAVFSYDGKRVLTASKDKTARVWDAATGKELVKFEGHGDDVLCAAFTPDGKRAVSGGADALVRLWDVETGKEVRRFKGHSTVIWSVAVSPDGKWALSGAGCRPRGDGFYSPAGEDSELRLWDVETGVLLHRLEGPSGSVMAVRFSADGRTVAAGGSDRVIHVWSVTAVKR